MLQSMGLQRVRQNEETELNLKYAKTEDTSRVDAYPAKKTKQGEEIYAQFSCSVMSDSL